MLLFVLLGGLNTWGAEPPTVSADGSALVLTGEDVIFNGLSVALGDPLFPQEDGDGADGGDSTLSMETLIRLVNAQAHTIQEQGDMIKVLQVRAAIFCVI